MSKALCAFCGIDSQFQPIVMSGGKSFDTPLYVCPQCGLYMLGTTLAIDSKGSSEVAFKIACLVREKQLASKGGLYGLFEDTFEPSEQNIPKDLSIWWRISDLLAEFPTPTQMIDRALLNLSRQIAHPFEAISSDWEQCEYLLFCRHREGRNLIGFMEGMGLLGNVSETRGSVCVTITPTGWQRIEEATRTTKDSRQAFVAMWFDDSMRSLYKEGIEPAVETAGFNCKRMDAIEHNNKICDEIIAEIRRSRFIIADFTGQRGGVYFEAGYGLGMGLPVIWLVRKDDAVNLHFDTRQYNHIVYETAEDLRQKLHNRIAATIH